MAVEAYIDYDKMMNLCDYIEERKDKIATLCDDELLTNRVNEIRENYGGEAADAYESEIREKIKKVEDEITALVEQLKKEANTQKEAWESQDSTLAG